MFGDPRLFPWRHAPITCQSEHSCHPLRFTVTARARGSGEMKADFRLRGDSRRGKHRAARSRSLRRPANAGRGLQAYRRTLRNVVTTAAASFVLGGLLTGAASSLSAAATSTVPSPVLGGWQLNGTAALNTTASPPNLELTPATNWVTGSAFYPTPVAGAGITASFDVFLGSGSGADGMTFTLADASVTKPTALGVTGGGEGFSVTTGAAGITVTMDGTQVLTSAMTLPSQVLVGFTAATGGFNDIHQVQNVSISTGPPPPVPAVTGVSPSAGPASGGTSVTLTGTGFTGATAVQFGGTAATSFTVNSDISITAVSPAA